MSLYNSSKDTMLATTTNIAATFWRRLKGLLGTRELTEGQALMIMPCNSVHTFGMNYSIDVLFVDHKNRVLKTAEVLKPGRVSVCSGGSYAVELPAGTLAKTNTVVGDILEYR